MKCYQCPKPAMYLVTEKKIPLCLSCYSQFTQNMQAELEGHERMLNYLSDQIAFKVGVPPMGPRFPPRPKPAQISGVKLNNINVSNSVVGTINTGVIGSVDQTISALIQLGEPSLAEAIKTLTEAVVGSGDLDQNQKNELIEILGAVATEAATPKEERKNLVAKTLLDRAAQITALANDITDVCQKWWPVFAAAFQMVKG
ncbi:MAG: hypothetical protein HYV59_03705 [Planctomycetes bacterium]|nr:hypothetical protein [Planctomycetota bacterium]